jgi:hypothetical protein
MEKLAPVPGFKGLFVSETCEFFKERRGVLHRLKQFRRKDEYVLVGAKPDGGKNSKFYSHRLCLMAHRGLPPFPEAEARHLDGVRHHNHINNLAWGGVADQVADKNRHGRVLRGSAHPCAKLNDYQVFAARQMAQAGVKVKVIAAQMAVTVTTIYRVLNRERWTEPPEAPLAAGLFGLGQSVR